MSDENRVQVTNFFIGLCGMQVCAVSDATDEEILSTANRENPSGTEKGWSVVLRTKEQLQKYDLSENCLPVTCSDDSNKTHFLLMC